MPNQVSASPGAITYEILNAAVNSTYFDGRHNSRPVYLDLEDEHRSELSHRLGAEPSGIDALIGVNRRAILTRFGV